MTRLALVLTLIWLPALSMAQSEDTDSCGATGLLGLVGQSGDIARMLVLDQAARVIPLGTPITRDFRLDRINFDLDAEGAISRVWCG